MRVSRGFAWIALLGAFACAPRPPVAGAPCPCPANFVCNNEQCEPIDAGTTKPVDKPDAQPVVKEIPGCEGNKDLPHPRMFPLFPHQYINTLTSLTGVPSDKLRTPTFAVQSRERFMTSDESLKVSDTEAELFRENAKVAANALLATQLELSGCMPNREETFPACRSFLLNQATVAFRRKLELAESDELRSLLEQARVRFGMAESLKVALESIFQSPSFLYRSEVGADKSDSGKVIALTAYETASALSYFITDNPPDGLLLADAEAGKLATGDERAAHARRLLSGPEGHKKIQSFFKRLLGLDASLEGATPEFGATLASMRRETDAFLERHLWAEGATLDTLFSAHETFVDQNLAQHYGLSLPATSVAPGQWVTIPQRKGLLSQGLVMVSHPNPPQRLPQRRGMMIFEALECIALLQLPTEGVIVRANTDLPSDATGREIAEHFWATTPSRCHPCHQEITELSLSFEQFDELGRYRENQLGKPIDPQFVKKGMGRFASGPDYVEALMKTESGQDCLVRQLTTFALGVADDYPNESPSCLVKRFSQAWRRTSLRVPDLFVEMARDDAFVNRW